MKKVIIIVLAIIMLLGSATLSYGAGYLDLKTSNWAYEAVEAISAKDIIKGYPDGSFKPNNTVTYGEFIKMALIAETGQDVGNAQKGYWATSYYDKALELGYFSAHDIYKSQLGFEISRGDMALIISAILGDVKIEDYDKIQKGIKDIDYKSKHEYDITKVYYAGILTGYTDNTFKPEQTLSRAESATVIYRLVDESKRAVPGGIKEEVKKVKDIVKNIDSFINPGDGSLNENLANVKTYEILKDASKYNMSLKTNRGTNWIQIDNPSGIHQLFLMKDGNIVESMQDTPRPDGTRVAIYESDITKIDYIVSLNVPDNSMDLIVNPFRK